MQIQVLIADREPVVRCGLRKILEETPDLVVGAETGSGSIALEMLRTRSWGVLVLDLWLAGRTGLELIKLAKTEQPRLPILVFTAQREEHCALRAIRAGASGYLRKDAEPEQVVVALRSVAAGGVSFSQRLAELLSTDARTAGAPPHATLTDREYGILGRILRGEALTEIAEDLSLSIKTVSTHKSHILGKLNLQGQVDLVRYAIEHKLMDLSPE